MGIASCMCCMQEAESIFKVFDKDFDGKLQALEMHQALGAAGLCPA